MASPPVPSAGIIVIGDEILKGHVQDTNSHYLAKELWNLGIRVLKVSVIGDDIDTIACEVKAFSSRYDFVLTCGGIGPTHDDVTMEGIAKSFDEQVFPHSDLIKAYFNDIPYIEGDPVFKMTLVPQSAVVYTDNLLECPLIVTGNVYTYAGLPSAMRGTFQSHKNVFKTNEQVKFYLKEIFYSVEEDVIAKSLAELQREYKTIQIGSYPNNEPRPAHRVKVTLEGLDASLVDKVYCSSLLSVNHEAVMSVKDSWNHSEGQKLKSSLKWMEDHMCGRRIHISPVSLLERISESLRILQEAITKYRPENICVAFTGGKDCTVLLSLYSALLKRQFNSNDIYHQIKALYVVPKNSFSEVEEFIDQCTKRYNLDLIKIDGTIKDALFKLKSSYPSIQAIMMGTRNTDPHSSKLTPFTCTDPGWPEYTRVNCILDWSYSQIWLFLRLFRVPYCKLYDKGYTSLGDHYNTRPNPALSSGECQGGHNCILYQPAYCLSDESLERAGRNGNGK